MLGIYNMLAFGLGVSGVTAFLTATFAVADGEMTAFGSIVLNPIVSLVLMLSMIGFLWFLPRILEPLSARNKMALYYGFTAVFGVTLAPVLLVYTGASVAKVFFITAAAFAALSLFGYTTKKDLSPWGSFLIMGVFGLIIASIVNIFLGSVMLEFVISAAGVLIFAGLTAYDTQALKEAYAPERSTRDEIVSTQVMGAINLFLDFINLFLMLLRLIGERR